MTTSGTYKAKDWPAQMLQRIAAADDLHVAPFRDDGVIYGTPTWIWSVVVGRSLYVRAYNGVDSRWYQAAIRLQAGRITTAGMTLEVIFERADRALNDQIDAAYSRKYASSAYLRPMIGPRARAATVGVLLRDFSG